jgi:hypothetical protein
MTFSGLLQAPTTLSKELTHVLIDCEAVWMLSESITTYALVLLALRCADLESRVWVVLTYTADRGWSAVQNGRRVFQMVQLKIGLVTNILHCVPCSTEKKKNTTAYESCFSSQAVLVYFPSKKTDIICHAICVATKPSCAKMYKNSVFILINMKEPFYTVFNFICLIFITFLN